MKFLSVMDPLEALSLDQDTTIGFMNSAAIRGHDLSLCTPDDLFLIGDQTWATTRQVSLPAPNEVHVIREETCPLSDFDCVWMRKDPPVDQSFLHATYLLDFANTWVINPPAQLRALNEKLYALHFIDLTPPTRVSSNPELILDWLNQEGAPLIVKPLDGYGGLGVALLDSKDRNSRVTLELLTDHGSRRVVVQSYLPAARTGDHRVIIINGKVIGAVLRTPQPDDHRGNIHVGGKVSHSPLSDEELKICERVAVQLSKDGIFFAGLDLIGGVLTEINITSPTGIRELKALTGIDAGDIFVSEIECEVEQRRKTP